MAHPLPLSRKRNGHCQQSYRLPPVTHRLSHGLRNMPPACFLPAQRASRPFKSLGLQSRKSPTPNGVGLFLAGAQGLEPWAYGFGDRRSTNWAIPLYLKRRRPLINWWAFRDSNPGLSGYEPEALTNWAKGPFRSRVRGTIARRIVSPFLRSVKVFLFKFSCIWKSKMIILQLFLQKTWFPAK